MSQDSTNLVFNVAGLLKETVGATRHYELQEARVSLDEDLVARDLTGSLRLLRIKHGVLAQADAVADVVLECARCLEEVDSELEVSFEEEFRPSIDVTTGSPAAGALEGESEDDFTRLTANHLLDLGEPVRQALLVSVPYSPVCREDCAGLCPECGQNLNEGDCGHGGATQDPRWAGLAALLDDDFDDQRRDS